MRFIILLLLFYSCQIDSGFKDLTPENGLSPTSFFNSPAFTEAIANLGDAEVDTVFFIERPEYLSLSPLYVIEEGWMTTDTFAFETEDFQNVLDVITRTAESHRDSIQHSVVSSELAKISLNGQAAYSVPGEYYLVPYYLSTGKSIYIQITRTKSTGDRYWTTWHYTANGLWMIGKEKEVKPENDVS